MREVQITVTLWLEKYERLEALARAKSTSINAIIEDALDAYEPLDVPATAQLDQNGDKP